MPLLFEARWGGWWGTIASASALMWHRSGHWLHWPGLWLSSRMGRWHVPSGLVQTLPVPEKNGRWALDSVVLPVGSPGPSQVRPYVLCTCVCSACAAVWVWFCVSRCVGGCVLYLCMNVWASMPLGRCVSLCVNGISVCVQAHLWWGGIARLASTSAHCLSLLTVPWPGCSLDDNGIEFPIGQIWSPGDPCELCICQVNDNLTFSCFTRLPALSDDARPSPWTIPHKLQSPLPTHLYRKGGA